MFLGELAAHVAVGELIDVQPGQLEVGPRSALVVEAFQDLADDHVGVRMPAIFRHDRGDFLFHDHLSLGDSLVVFWRPWRNRLDSTVSMPFSVLRTTREATPSNSSRIAKPRSGPRTATTLVKLSDIIPRRATTVTLIRPTSPTPVRGS